MEKILENVIRKLIFKKYPFLYDVNVKDLFGDIKGYPSLLGTSFICNLKSKECLESSKQEEIDTEIKTLFKIIHIKENTMENYYILIK
jgi:hypothetical protein